MWACDGAHLLTDVGALLRVFEVDIKHVLRPAVVVKCRVMVQMRLGGVMNRVAATGLLVAPTSSGFSFVVETEFGRDYG